MLPLVLSKKFFENSIIKIRTASPIVPFLNRSIRIILSLCSRVMPVPRQMPPMPSVVVSNIQWTTIRIPISDFLAIIERIVMGAWIRIKESV